METVYVTADEADTINATFREFGAANKPMLEAAIGVPASSYAGEDLHPRLLEKASLLLTHLVKAHAFPDGNKRTAWVMTFLFLQRNNVKLRTMSKYEIAGILEAVATNLMSAAEVETWLKNNSTVDGSEAHIVVEFVFTDKDGEEPSLELTSIESSCDEKFSSDDLENLAESAGQSDYWNSEMASDILEAITKGATRPSGRIVVWK